MSRDPNFKSRDLRERIEGRRQLANPKGGRGVPPPAATGYRRKPGPKECSVCVPDDSNTWIKIYIS